jgi:hypothetical protein
MAKLQRVEIWDALGCDSGVRKAVVRDSLLAEDRLRLDGNDQLRIQMPLTDPAWAEATVRRVIRILLDDDDYREWRIVKRQRDRKAEATSGELIAVSILNDLLLGLVTRTESDGSTWGEFEILGRTPSQLLTDFILPAAPSYFAAGTVSYTGDVSFSFDGDTPLSALQELAKLTDMELAVRRNGSTNYLIDLVQQIGSAAPESTLWLGKNLQAVRYVQDARQQATRVYPRGGEVDDIRLTIAGTPWEVVGKSVNVLTLQDPLGTDGPVGFDDQFNGLYLLATDDSVIAITDSDSGAQTVTVADGSKFTVNDLVYFKRNSGGDDLFYLEAPSQVSTYGVVPKFLDRPDIAYVRNVIANPMLNGTYASGLPPNWTKLGTATPTENTNALYTRHGGKSCKVVGVVDGDGIESAATSISPTARQPYFSAYLSIWIVSGTVRVELVDVTNGKVYPSGDEGRAISNVHDHWVELGVAGLDLYTEGTLSVKLRIVQDGDGASEFYVDTGQITQSAGQLPFFSGDGATELWFAAQNALLDDADPRIEIDVNLIDLWRQDETTWPYDELVIGGDVRAKDTSLTLDVTTRVVSLTRDLLTDTKTNATLSKDPALLTDRLRRPPRRPRFGARASSLFDQIGVADPAIGPEGVADEMISYPIVWDADTAYVEVWSRESSGASTPAVPETGSFYVGRFRPPIAQVDIATTNLYYRRTRFAAFTKDGIRGVTMEFGPTQADNPNTGPSAPPSGLTIGTETSTTVPLTWTNGDSSASTRIYRDGQVVHTEPPGSSSWTDTGLAPSTSYDYEIDHYKDDVASAKDGPDTATTLASGTLPAPTSFTAACSATYGVLCNWSSEDPSAKTVIERSPDGASGWIERGTANEGVQKWWDYTRDDGSTWYWRAFHRKDGWTDSAPTSSQSADYPLNGVCV